MPPARREGHRDQTADADGQPGPLVRRRAAGQRIHPVRRHRHRHRSARVDQSAARVLAAGHSAPRSAARECQGPAVEHERRDDARRGFFRLVSRRPTSSPGTCSSGRSRHIDYHPIYHPFNWRGWTDWGVGAIGDMGAHLIDSSFWSLDLDYPDQRRDHVDALQPRHLSDGVHHLLRVRRRRARGPP